MRVTASLCACLHPDLNPDGYKSADSGWPRALRRFDAQAWRRAGAGELDEDELYRYQACKTRIRREREEIARVASKSIAALYETVEAVEV